ncbi:glutathione peroxidase [Legionella londiniensis]|uniref:Glutathione peroxidase n=1 Tax=Legionella londiniensis TaxID=45068 RepID=A0A0W0VJ58_9GAMM|nr:glutathione peroxidase [Legionella londiniensis]KTD20148.1 glutathione peroxidase [Legionella londiniensis]STX94315.1 glutathione peroxidase [Legionella londiniensis]
MNHKNQADDLYHVPVTTINGEKTNLEPFKGKVLLIVNVASRCSFTKQYAMLEALYQEYKERGFVVLGFPCNQFLHQEPGSHEEIKTFAESCFRVSFPLFGKVDVRGSRQSPLYAYLASHIEKKPFILVPWNFTKFLISQEGRVLGRYGPLASMTTIRQAIEKLLQDKQ